MHKPLFRPWFSIWFNPRETIRQVIKTDPNHMIPLLAVLLGTASTLDNAIGRNMGDRVDGLVLIILIVTIGPLGGVISLYVGSWLLRWFGSWLGGRATVPAVRAAMAWSSLPQLLGLLLNLLFVGLMGAEAFTRETPLIDARMAANPGFDTLVKMVTPLLLGLGIGLGIWNLILASKCLGEVFKFSAWRGLATLLLPVFVVGIPLTACIVGFGLLS